MYTKSEHRRKLGMMTRKIVQKSFSGDRYLREHEQMLWIGKSAKMMASRAAGDPIEPADVAAAIENGVDEEIITIPRGAVHSWRSSAVSGVSTLYSSVSHVPGRGGYHRPMSDISTMSMSNVSTDAESFARLPVFAPRQSMMSTGGSPGNRSPMWTSNHRLSVLGSRAHSPRPQSHSRSISTAGREQIRGLHREDFAPYRNSDVSVVMRDEFIRSGGLLPSG
jgi:hypothetical protein